MPVTSRRCHTRHRYRVPPEQDATHGIGIMAMDIEYHQNRMPHTASVSWPWVSSTTRTGHHTWHRHRFNGYQFHRYLVHGISCIDACHLQRTPHTASVSWPWVSGSWCRLHGHRGCHTWHRYRLHGHRHLVHGVGCMSIEDATHGISIDCMDLGIMAIGIWFMASAA